MDRIKATLRRYWGAFFIPAAFVVILVTLWAIPPTRLIFQAAYFTAEMFGGVPNNPYEWATSEPTQQRLTYSGAVDGRLVQFEADVYSPGSGGRHGTVLGVVGALDKGIDDPRVVRLARGVARMGIVMMLPTMDQLENDRLDPEEIDEVIVAFHELRKRPDVDPNQVAIVGFSVGAGPALVAASDPTVRGNVEFAASFGGYYDIFDLIGELTSRTLLVDDRLESWDPSARSLQILRRSLISYVKDPGEHLLLSSIFLHNLEVDPATIANLSPMARTVHDLLSNTDPERVDALFAAAPAEATAILRRLSPSTYLHNLQTDLYLLHDRNDRFIPYVESRRLAENLPDGVNLTYVETDLFRHTIPRVTSNPVSFVIELMKFFFLIYRMALQLI